MQASTYFPKVRRIVALSSSFNFNTLLASLPCSCHSVSSWDRSSNFGAIGLRWWSSPRQIYPSERYWFRFLVWRAIAFVNFVRLATTSAAPCLERHNPIVVYSMICTQHVRVSTHDGCHALQRVAPFDRDFRHGSQQVAMFYRASHTSSTWLLHFCHHSFWTFY